MNIFQFIIEHQEAIFTLLAAIITRAIEKPKAEKKAVEKSKKQAND